MRLRLAKSGCNPWGPSSVPSSVWAIIAIAVWCAFPALAQDAREIVRKSVELDQVNWLRMADYTWIARERERHFDSRHRVTSSHEKGWETLVLDGAPYRRLLERDDKPLPVDQQRKEQEKLDKAVTRLDGETPEQKQRRLEAYQEERLRQRKFLLEVSEAFNFRMEPDETINGQPVWVISGVPKPGYQAHSREGRALLKIRGKIWIEKAGYQWVRIEAQTTATISFGLFLARLNPGASMIFEQTRVNNEVWLPRREYLRGTGRIGLLKRLEEDDEITWSNYRKFDVNSRIVPAGP
jgi:hypothetical protein